MMRYLYDVFLGIRLFSSALIGLSSLLLLTFFNQAMAEEFVQPDVQLHFKRFSLDQGLPSAYINSLTQTDDGYIWIGSRSGLSRFDGYTFVNYKLTSELEHAGISNDVIEVVATSNTQLWVGTDNGLYRFDVREERFIPIPFDDNERHTILSINVYSDNQLWVGTDRGLYVVDSQSISPTAAAISALQASVKFVIPHQNKLWIGTKSGLYVMPLQGETALTKGPVRKIPLVEDSNFDVRNARLFDALLDDNQLYLATDGDGLLVVDTATETITSQYLSDQPFIQSNSIWSVKKQGDWLWLGYFYDGLSAWQPHLSQHFHSAYDAQITYSIPFNNISELLFDRQGLLWVATTNGLAVGDVSNRHVLHLGEYQGITNKHLWSTLFSKDGLWFGSESGLNYYDRKEKRLITYPPSRQKEQLPKSIIWSIADAGSELILGSNRGLLRFNKKSRRVTPVPPPNPSLQDAPIYSLKAMGVNLLVAFDNGDLASWDSKERRYTHYLKDAAADYITTMVDSEQGYIAGSRSGLYQINHMLNKSSPIVLVNTELAIDKLHITSLVQHQQVIWVATMNQGVLAITFKDNSWHLVYHLTEKNGLQENQVRSLALSQHNALWIAGTTQIMQLDLNTLKVIHFSHLTHWLNMEYHANTVAVSEDGAIAFGGNQGLLMFNPNDLQASALTPTLNLAAYQVMDTTYHQHTDTLTLLPGENYVAFTLAALNYLSPQSMHYQYRLPPLNTTWQNMSSRQLSLSQLPYGTYQLEVRATHNASEWQAPPLTLNIEVQAPWWWSAMAQIVYLIVAVAVLLWLLYYVHRRLLSLRFFARHDSLTGLPNRLYFEQELRQRIAQAKRQQTSLALVYIDLNGFKQTNDEYGHQAGDLILTHFSKTVQQAIRQADFFSRLGGDEFVLMLDQIDRRQTIIQLIERIHTLLEKGVKWQGHSLDIKASFGIATYNPANPVENDELIRRADKAMYECKQKGLAYCFYSKQD
ncbi:ligand-binding sensor domain-containing diguanylate cyclase [Lacimicrobium sp. SS2-24]|uniref:ligand-binding sensor domain-containing diguanylate cyclase n=1 Tax=Lacimicrobium sp. SS2-24 TaxID=2005569 RepID=UPI000B4A7363|nr:ligand-binding sensor domain-containing diguanylate cyclase [Lacimicrobium sp. SS2-24]